MKTPLYNTAHPLAESGKPIFIPFGEWNYDGQSRQRLDRAHGEKIANELNARVAKGDPGIPVYQGHPDVPALASKYPDKGALGWITRIELVNESPDGRAVPGLALTVEWDRDPGRGFRWFSPYWLANSREGSTYIVDEIASIGLVNNPNIPEFRLANEEQPMKKKLNPAIIELAARYDRLANEANFDESKHPRSDDGKFASGGGGGGATGGVSRPSVKEQSAKKQGQADKDIRVIAAGGSRDETLGVINGELSSGRWYVKNGGRDSDRAEGMARRKAAHRLALLSGFTYNPKTHQYEERDRLANEANFDESKHPRSEDGKFTSGGGSGGASGKSPSPELKAKADAARAKAGTISPSAREWASDKIFLGAKDITHEGLAKRINSAKAENHASREDKSVRVERLRALHAKAISLGFRYNTATGNYE